MERVLIDTDIFIDCFSNYGQSSELLSSWLEGKEVYFSAITETELLAGKDCRKPEVENKVLALLMQARKVEVDNWIARNAGQMKRECPISTTDALIAASALKVDAVLYTRNLKDFRQIKGLKAKAPY